MDEYEHGKVTHTHKNKQAEEKRTNKANSKKETRENQSVNSMRWLYTSPSAAIQKPNANNKNKSKQLPKHTHTHTLTLCPTPSNYISSF